MNLAETPYTCVTYGTASVYLEEGWYTLGDLKELIAQREALCRVNAESTKEKANEVP